MPDVRYRPSMNCAGPWPRWQRHGTIAEPSFDLPANRAPSKSCAKSKHRPVMAFGKVLDRAGR